MSWNAPPIHPGDEIRGSDEERRRAWLGRAALFATGGAFGVGNLNLSSGVQLRLRDGVLRLRMRDVWGVSADGTIFWLQGREAVTAALTVGDAASAVFDAALCHRRPSLLSADRAAARTIELVISSTEQPQRAPSSASGSSVAGQLDLGRFTWRRDSPALRWVVRPVVLRLDALKPRDAEWAAWTAPLCGKIESWLRETEALHGGSLRHATLMGHLVRLAHTWPAATIVELAIDVRLAARLRRAARALGSSLPELLHPEPLSLPSCRNGVEQIARLMDLAVAEDRDEDGSARRLLRPDEVEWEWCTEDSLWVELRVEPGRRPIVLRLPDLAALHDRVHVLCEDAALDRDLEARRVGGSKRFAIPRHRLRASHRLQFSGLRAAAHDRPDAEVWIQEQNGNDDATRA